MSFKSSVSSEYLKDQMVLHGDKPYPKDYAIPQAINAFFTGAWRPGSRRPGSIGEMIIKNIDESGGVTSYSISDDVRFSTVQISSETNTLIMCHGVSHLDWFEDIPLEKAREIFDVNLFGSFNVAQEFVKATIHSPVRKRIISIGSMAYKSVLNGSAAYCASKAGLAMLMKCLAWELAPKGYDVYCIHPSNTLDTPMSEETIAGLMRYRMMNRREAEAYWDDTQIRRQSLTKQEIADMVMHILSGKAPYLSGCNIELAGGQR